jgi:hypothetical protein
MSSETHTEPTGWQVGQTFFRLAVLGPYLVLWKLGRMVAADRDRLAAEQLSYFLELHGEPVPDPPVSTAELRERMFALLTSNDPLARGPGAYAAEGWLVLGARVTAVFCMAATAGVLAGALALGWWLGPAWADARIASAPTWGWAVVGAAAGGAALVAGWVSLVAGWLAMQGPGPGSWASAPGECATRCTARRSNRWRPGLKLSAGDSLLEEQRDRGVRRGAPEPILIGPGRE